MTLLANSAYGSMTATTDAPYKPDWDAEEEAFLLRHPGDRLITNQGLVTAPFPIMPSLHASARKWSGYVRREENWYASEGNRAYELMGEPCRFDARNLSSSDIDVVLHLLFDPEWGSIANYRRPRLGDFGLCGFDLSH